MNRLHTNRQQLQRTILSEMNIDCWIGSQKKTEVIQLLDIYPQENNNINNKLKNIFPQELEINCTGKSSPLIESTVETPPIKPIIKKSKNDKLKNQQMADTDLIPSFQLEAIYYNHWVLVVDVSYLDNDEVRQLWDSMCQKLASKVETQKFPVATKINIPTIAPQAMNTLKLANIVLTAFIYRLSKNSDFKLVKLTKWADGLQHDKLHPSPSLQQMVDNPQIKKQFWQTISQK